jgi:Domain of unknown function (DUF5916)/Carbohydrate family 9 binding domain-like
MKNVCLCVVLLLLSSRAFFAQQLAEPNATPTPVPAKTAAEAAGKTDPKSAAKSSKGSFVLPPEKAQPVKMAHFDKPPVIDGKLDDEVWQHAVLLKDFYQVQPGDNIAPSERTEVMLGFDAKFLYVAFHCYDDPTKVRANIPKRDNIFDDDYVGILFDTFNDHRKAYEFDFNPLGVQADGVWTDGQNEDFNPDIVMESKGMVTTDGWTVEVAIPFKSLRYVAGKDKLWGAHFWRRIKRFNNELDMWMPLNRDISSWLAQAGHLSGLEGISSERTLELIPSLTVSETGKRKGTLSPAQLNAGMRDPGHFVNEPIKFDPGLTGKYTLTPTVTLDFALNPDFAQVEADQLVVRANQRFPIFFPEKRPFFLEGIDIFNTQISAVDTRAIADPDVAVKLSGKVNSNTFGLLVASDNGPGNLSEDDRAYLVTNPLFLAGIDPVPANLTASQKSQIANVRFRQAQLAHLLDKNSLAGILRLKHDVGAKDSFIGFLGTTYNFAGTDNQLAGFDGRQRINKQTTFSWQALGTTSMNDFFYADSGQTLRRRENGFAYAYDYNQDGRHFGYDFSGVGRTRYFRSDVGFNRRVNTNNDNLFVRYNSEPKPKAKLVSWRFYDDISTNFDWQGRSQVVNNEAQIQFNFPRSSTLGIGFDKGYERVFEEEFGPRRQPGSNCVVDNNCTFAGADNERSAYNKSIYLFAGSTINKKLNFIVFTSRGFGNLDFDFGAGSRYPRVSPPAIAARQASAQGLCPDLNGHFAAACNAPFDPGPGAFFHIDGNISYQPSTPLNLTLSFTKERLRRYDTELLAFDENILSLKGTYQFTRFIFARGRIDFDSLGSNVKGQFLFGWAPNPGTAFYVGYNDDVNRRGFNPFSGQLEPGLRRNGRTFFIKMSYLIRRSFEKK